MVKEATGEYLKTIGLTLSKEKTHITHIKKGFDFLGFTLKKHVKLGIKNPKGIRDYKLLITPSREKVIRILRNCKEVLDTNKATTQEVVIKLLNSRIRGWGNFYRFANSKLTFGKIDYAIWHKSRRWCRRRHPNKSEQWIFDNLFRKRRKSLYFETDTISLRRLTTIAISNHPKVAKGKRVYCKDHTDYWKQREYKLMVNKLFSKHKTLYIKQKGICSYCNYPFAFEDSLHAHHITPRAEGGTDEQSNLRLLHAECHRDLHRLAS